MSAEDERNGLNLDRILLGVALLSGVGSSAVGILGTEDRFYGAEGCQIEVRIDYIDAAIKEVKTDIRRLDDNHPPADLLQDVGEMRQRIRELEKLNLKHSHD